MSMIDSLHLPFVMEHWHRLARIGQSATARALRDGLLWLVPYLMLWSALMLGAAMLNLADWQPAIAGFLETSANSLRVALPLVMWGSLGAMCAVQRHLPRSAVAFICVACGAILQHLLALHTRSAAPYFIPLAIVGPLLAVSVLGRLMRQPWMRLAHQPTEAGQNVSDALNLVLPSLLTVALLGLGLHALALLLAASPVPDLEAVMHGLSPTQRAALYCLMNSLLWANGVHGYYALLPLLETIPVMQSVQGGPVSQSFLGLFVFIGGSGSTASLIVAILVASRMGKHRMIALASLAPAIINVNELLLFGLPVILNLRLFVPFLVVPVVNLAVASLASSAGWIAPASVELPFNSPILLNALIATGGDQAAMLLQVVNVAIGALVYAPFVVAWERDLQRDHGLLLKSIDTSFGQRKEEAALLLDDPVGAFQRARAEQATLESRIRDLGGFEFVLHFQPKVSPASGRITGCEALLRLDNGEGRVLMPDDFLPEFERARLMKEVDLWVLKAAVRQISAWKDAHLPPVEVAVNVCVDSLSDRSSVAQLADLVSHHAGQIVLEITEHSLIGDVSTTQWALERLRRAGARIHIDDFGTGFSSLSYLHRFVLDGIKIDRSFTNSLDQERGRHVFGAMCSLARELKLEIVIEGLEQGWQLRHLPPDDALMVQGWYYSRALPATSFADYLRANVSAEVAYRA